MINNGRQKASHFAIYDIKFGESKMKLTEARIKEIIFEEITKLSEQEEVPEQTAEAAEEIISKMSNEEQRLIVQNYISSLKEKAGI